MLAASASADKPKQQRPLPAGPIHNRRHHELAATHVNNNNNKKRQLASSSDESSSARLRTELLNNYDKGSYPWNTVWNSTSTTTTQNDEIRTGLEIELDLNFHKVFSIDVTNSVVDMVVWVRQRWKDPRLAWDPADYDGLQNAWFWIDAGTGPGGETSEIWTPDLELWNMEESLSTSLTSTHAIVTPDGTVFWSRPGHIKPVCKFRGLDQFPFDSLECTMEIGSWSFSGLYIRPTLMNDKGYSIGGSDTAGEAFAEYSLSNVDAEEHIYPPYPSAPSEDWPVIFYHVTFDRAWQPYARGYLVLQIVLNLIAFCCFWLPPHIGERMSLSITAVLAAVASELVVSASLPAASDATWFSKFSIASLMFASIALFESAAVIYFYYKTGDDMIPHWFKILKEKVKGTVKKVRDKHKRGAEERTGGSSQRSSFEMRGTDADEKKFETSRGSEFNDEFKGDPYNDKEHPISMKLSRMDAELRKVAAADDSGDESGDGLESKSRVSFDEDLERRRPSSLRSPDDANGDRRPSALRFNDQQPAEVVVDRRRPSTLDFHRKLSTSTRVGIKTVLGRDADDFKNAKEMENNLRWQKVASAIDNFSRVFFPAAYIVFLAVSFSGSGI